MKGLGQGVRSFKDGMKEVTEDTSSTESSQAASEKKEPSIKEEDNGK